MMEENVVPLLHVDSDGNTVFDGIGFIVGIDRRSVLITCRHVFEGEHIGKMHSFIYNGSTFDIDMESSITKYFESQASHQLPKKIKDEYFGVIEDYAFYDLPFEVENPLELISTKDVGLEDDLSLITFEENRRKVIPCSRKSLEETASHYQYDFDFPVIINNLIEVAITGIKGGDSGAPIVHVASQKCIGFLHGGQAPIQKEKDYKVGLVIKAQTISEQYFQLKKQHG